MESEQLRVRKNFKGWLDRPFISQMRKVKPTEGKGQKFGDDLDKSWNKTVGHWIP